MSSNEGLLRSHDREDSAPEPKTSSGPVRVMVVDDHPLFRFGLAPHSPNVTTSRSWARRPADRPRSRPPRRCSPTSS